MSETATIEVQVHPVAAKDSNEIGRYDVNVTFDHVCAWTCFEFDPDDKAAHERAEMKVRACIDGIAVAFRFFGGFDMAGQLANQRFELVERLMHPR